MFRTWRVRWFILFAVALLVLVVDISLLVMAGPDWGALGAIATLLFSLAGIFVLYRGIRHEEEQRQVLLKIAEDLSSRLELGDLLDYIVHALLRLVPLANKCVIHLLDEPGRRLYPRYSSQPDWQRSLGMPVDKGIAGQALKGLVTKVVPDVRHDTSFLPLHSSSDLRALIVAPLHSQGKPLGTISLNSNVPGAFSKGDEFLVTTLAAQVSSAIYQTQLYGAALRETHFAEAIINNLADGLLVLDAEDRVVRHNLSLAEILGMELSGIAGQKVDARSENEGLRRLSQVLADLPRDTHQTYERAIELEEPIAVRLRVHGSSVVDSEGNREQIILLHDETDEANLIRAKSGFITAASRELLPPLESIRGYAMLLMSYDLPERTPVTQWASLIREQSGRLIRLAEDLSDLCAVDCNEVKIKTELVAVQELLEDVLDELAQPIQRKRLVIEVKCPPNLPKLPLDQERIRHVLLNLLENALHRAAPGGHILLKLEASLQELTLTLADDGQKVPQEDRARIFQGLYHSNGATPHDSVGTGLGLYISRKIIEAHGGHLWMPEDGTRGAKFQFILPVDTPVGTPGPASRPGPTAVATRE